jgi:nucleotide-binding universal stress UspA family protein
VALAESGAEKYGCRARETLLTAGVGRRDNRLGFKREGGVMFKSIIWASDGSENADRALEHVRELAEADSGRIVAVHVKELTIGRGAGYPVQLNEEEVERKIQEQAAELKNAGTDAKYEQIPAATGGAAHAIADLADKEGADLIVVGTRGQAPIAGLLLGSVTQRLLHIAPCPVLAVPPKKA